MNNVSDKDEHIPTILRIGFWSSFIAFLGAAGYSVAQILQVLDLLHPPWDGILIFGFSLCIATPFTISMAALHYTVADNRKFWSHTSLIFAAIYTVYVNLNYVVQLATVIPASLNAVPGEIRILDQTPHSLFWDIDALGYIFMGLATLSASPVFAKSEREKWLRRFLLANGLITPVIALVYFYPTFSIYLLILGSPWIITATGSIFFLMLYFRGRIAARQ